MFSIVRITLLGILRDRLLQGILVLASMFLCIPSVASLSMRQATELAVTLSLSLVSFVLLLLAVFLGANSIWRDMDRRYTFSVLSLPLSRSAYVVARFLGIALFVLLVSLVLLLLAASAVAVTSGLYPPERPLVWGYFALSGLLMALQYVLLVAVAVLLSTVSTSFFLPVFGTVSIYIASSVMQQVHVYLDSSAGKEIAPVVHVVASTAYYLLPNFSGFDLKAHAIYGIAPDFHGVLLTFGYFAVYTILLISAASLIFERREMK